MAESAPTVGGRIFISYRRDDTAYAAGWLFDRLASRYGDDQVFKDVDSIELGDDFVEVISAAVGSCDVLLALIGDRWLTLSDDTGKRRLDNPGDFVRLEIESALKRDVLVIPVLVHGARMPGAAELPPSLAALPRRQALELSANRFNADTSLLLEALDKTLADLRPTQQREVPPVRRRRRISRRTQVLGGVGAAVLALAAVLIAVLASGSDPQAKASLAGTLVFQDRFSNRSGGWDDAGKSRNGGHYKSGAYRMYSKWTKDHWSEQAYPRGARSVFPTAPRDVRVAVVARRVAGGADVGYGMVCRASRGSGSYYQFAIWEDHLAIEKLIPQAPFYVQLGYSNLDPVVRANGKNRIQATCTTDGSRRVHLALRVNGTTLATAIDSEKPLLSGGVGLGVANGENSGAIEAEFDDFVVTRA